MKRVRGNEGVMLIECINPYVNKWRVRWDIRINTTTDNPVHVEGVNYMEEEFLYQPSFFEIRELITKWFNIQIDEKILSGFVWHDYPVWLSTENQFNYKAAYDLAIQTKGDTLPVTFKFGSDEEPVYHEFQTVEDLKDFYLKSVTFVQGVLKQGWLDKDTFDFTPYQI